jgi:hypothetical protein
MTPEPNPIRLIALPSLFIERGRIDRYLPPGSTVSEHMRRIGWDPKTMHARVSIDGRFVESALWEYTITRAGQSVVMRCIPGTGGGGGGGKSTMQIVAMLGVVALAFAAPWAAMAIGAALGAGASSVVFFSGIAGTLLTAGVGIGGMLAVNALIPPPRPQLPELSGNSGSTSPTLSLTGSSNAFVPYGPIPRIYGRHRIFPPLVARPFTEIKGNKQFLRLVFCCGYGPLELSDLKIGETPLDPTNANEVLEDGTLTIKNGPFAGITLEVLSGHANDPALKMMPQDVFEEQLNILLATRQRASTVWFQRRTQRNTVEISLDMALPLGLGRQIAKYRGARTWEVAVEYRLAGDPGAWTSTTKTDVKATATTAFSGANNDLVFTAKAYGHAGNNVHIRFVHRQLLSTRTGLQWTPFIQAGPNVPLPSPRSNYAVPSIQIGIIQGVTTANDVKAGIAANAQANALVTVADAGGNNGTGTIALTTTASRGGQVYVNADYQLSGGDDSVPLFSVTALSDSALRYNHSFRVPAGEYDVRVMKTSAYVSGFDGTLIIQDTTYWTMLRSIQQGTAVRKAGLALIGMRIQSTDQLNGIIDKFNCVGTSILPVWDGVNWTPGPTNNPASVYFSLMTGTSNRKPKDDVRMDLPTLQAFYDECELQGYGFSAVIDFRTTVRQLRQDILSAGRATFAMRDMKYSLIMEQLQPTPVDVITPRNSWGFKWTKRFVEIPHAFKVRFVDEANNWEQGERTVYADGYTQSNASIFEEVDAGLGVTSDRQVYRLKRRELKEALGRSQDYQVQMDVENITFTRGDRVQLVHDVILAGVDQGRIIAMTQSVSAVISSLTLDELVDFDGGKFYTMRVKSAQGLQTLYPLAIFAGSTNILTPQPSIATFYPAITDYSGNGTDGVFNGPCRTGDYGPHQAVADPTTGTYLDGPNGAYLLFGGVNDFKFTDTAGAFTIEQWIKAPNFVGEGGTTQRYTGKFIDASNSWQTMVQQTGANGRFGVTVEWANVLVGKLADAGSADMLPDMWNHCVATFDGTNVTLTINNYLATQGANAAGLPASTTMITGRQNVATAVGRCGAAFTDVAYYPFVLTPAQIGRHWAASRSRGQNLLKHSEDLSQIGTWLNARTTETLNVSMAPNGTTTMDKMVDDLTAANSHYMYINNLAIPIGEVYTFSIYAKPAERSILRLQMNHGSIGTLGLIRVEYDLSTGLMTERPTSGTGVLVNHTMTAEANGSYRCSITGIYCGTVGAAPVMDILLIMQTAPNSVTYNGDGSSGLYLWGAQLEPGYAPTQYIPTSGAAVQLSGYHETVMNDAPSGYWRMHEQSSPGVGDLVTIGIAGQDSIDGIVTNIEMGQDFTATVTLQDYAPEIFDAAEEVIPPYQSDITIASTPQQVIPVPIVELIQSDEAVLTKDLDGTLHSRIVITLHFGSAIKELVSKVEAQYRLTGSSQNYVQIYAPISGNGSVVSIPDVRDGRNYDVRVRSISEDLGLFSGWINIDSYTVIGKTTPPPDPDVLELQADGVHWAYNPADEVDLPLDLRGFHLRWRSGAQAIWADAVPLTRWPTPLYKLPVVPDGTQRTVMVKAIDTAGHESTGFASVTLDVDDRIVGNITLTRPQHPTFSGTKTNCTVISNQLVADSSGGLFWHVPLDTNTGTPNWSPPFWTTDAALFWNGSSKEMHYSFVETPPMYVSIAGGTMFVNVASNDQGLLLEYRVHASAKFWTTDAAPFWSTDPTLFWSPITGVYYPWLGGVKAPRHHEYDFRITAIGGSVQAIITSINIQYDLPDKTRKLSRVYIPIGGLRLYALCFYSTGVPVFFLIQALTCTVLDEDYPMTKVRVMDLYTGGPMVVGRDDAGQPADGYILAVAHGY